VSRMVNVFMSKTSGGAYIREHFPQLVGHPLRSSRRYASGEKEHHKDGWWFAFKAEVVEDEGFVILAGATGSHSNTFYVFQVPGCYIKQNLSNFYVAPDGRIFVHIHFQSYMNVRDSSNLPFGQFLVNGPQILEG
jgi:hypothetical protein